MTPGQIRKILEEEIIVARRERDRIAILLAAEEGKLAALIEAARALREEMIEKHRLQDAHSDVTIPGMQAESAQSLGVRIAAGRKNQSESRKAQIAAGLTDEEVATLTDYNRSTVCKWHNGSMKVPEDARKLLAKHGIPGSSWKKR